jgi:hypothetical protein
VEAWSASGISAVGVEGSDFPLVVTLNDASSALFNGDQPTFADTGTVGNSRSHVSFKPALFARAQWNSTGSTGEFLTISSAPATSVVVQLSIELRSISAPVV